MTRRLESVRTRLRELGLAALLVTHRDHCYYLSGFSGSSPVELEAVLLITAEQQLLITDSRYWLQAEEEAPGWTLLRVEERLIATIRQVLGELGCTPIGFEPAAVTVALYQELAGKDTAASYTLSPAPGLLETLRISKDADELALIRQAVRLTDLAYRQVVAKITPGVTEAELALETEWIMRQQGASGVAFDIIVASGEQSALPHARPGPRALRAGDLVVMDMGARFGHYCADMTRTFAVAEITPPADQLYRVCYQAQTTGTREIRAGMTGREADRLVRDVITAAGYGEYFGHGTGHGVGLEIHEAPRLSRLSSEVLPVGATVTIEPGIYLPGVGGVRIEDLCVLTETGVEVLTAAEKPPELPVFG